MKRPKSPVRPRNLERRRLQSYVSKDLHKRLLLHCAATNASESSVVQTALIEYLDHSGDLSRFLRRLDGHGRTLRQLDSRLHSFNEGFSVWVQQWFAHTPALPSETKVLAAREGQQRYQRFLQIVAESVRKKSSAFGDSTDVVQLPEPEAEEA